MLTAFFLPLLAQAGASTIDLANTRHQPTAEEDRLTVCLDQATSDPSTAILTANSWFVEANGTERAFPQQCLGMAYTRLLRWQAAEDAFLGARTDTPAETPSQRAKLAAMAGNSAMADGRYDNALADLGMAAFDATNAGDAQMAGEIEIDRSRALVALGKTGEAGAALEKARKDAPQDADTWLLSATLSRRDGDLATAQTYIVTAAGLDRTNPQIGLEAGVIAALSGNDEAARKSFQSVIQTSPGTPEADTAKTYLAQLEPAPAEAPAQPPTPPPTQP